MPSPSTSNDNNTTINLSIATAMEYPSRIKRALIICDMQADLTASLFAKSSNTTNDNPKVDPAARREAFLDAVKSVLRASISSPLPDDNALIIFMGLRFPSRYEGLHGEHCLYGSLRRLNEKVGDQHCHWFMEGHAGSEINAELNQMATDSGAKHAMVWRSGHLPPASELSTHLTENAITDVTIVGAKASQSVQSTVQYVADYFPSIDLSVITEALADDGQERLDAMIQHLLPLYARVASLEEYVEATCGLEKFAESVAKEYNEKMEKKRQNVFYFSNCHRGGHFSIYTHHLTHRKASPLKEGSCWMNYPTQKWYEDVFRGKQFHCPLGKRVVTFCDEPSFSEIAMFIKGRDCLDDKAKLIELAKDYLPETYVVKGGLPGWETVDSFPSDGASGPWFVKETNKNGGRAIQLSSSASDCIALANNPQETYVIQRHIPNPHLTTDGRKWHFKLYNLLVSETSEENESLWTLRCHNEAFFCAASTPWSEDDLTPEAQLTVKRMKRFRIGRVMEELGEDVDVYETMLNKCTEIVAEVVGRGLKMKELEGRPGKKQFEIFSSDFMFDATLEKVHLIEFNFSPVIFDPLADQELTTEGLRKYHELYLEQGEEAEVNDHAMIRDAVSIMFFPKEAARAADANGNVGGWRLIQSF